MFRVIETPMAHATANEIIIRFRSLKIRWILGEFTLNYVYLSGLYAIVQI